jgi:hypothetical protein
MASRKGSRIGWRWVAIGATLAACMAIYGGTRMSRRSRRDMARRERATARFPSAPAGAPSAREPARTGAPKPVR